MATKIIDARQAKALFSIGRQVILLIAKKGLCEGTLLSILKGGNPRHFICHRTFDFSLEYKLQRCKPFILPGERYYFLAEVEKVGIKWAGDRYQLYYPNGTYIPSEQLSTTKRLARYMRKNLYAALWPGQLPPLVRVIVGSVHPDIP